MQVNTSYKQTPIGLIPTDWEVKKLGDIGELTSSKRVYLNDYVEFGVPFYRGKEISEIKAGKKVDDIIYISRKAYEIFKEKYGVPQINDLLITAVGTLGNVLRVANDDDFYFKDGNLIWIRKVDQNSFYLEQLLTFSSKEVLNTAIGSSQKALTIISLSKLLLPIPPLPEQQKIATILSTWDAAIDNCKAIIQKLQQRNKGLAQQLLTGKIRVKGFEKTKWVEKKADKIFKSVTDKTHNGELEILSATQERGVIPRSMGNIDIKYDEKSLGTYKKVEIGDYVISLRSFQGGIEYSEYEGIVSPAYTILKEIIPISKTFYKVYFKTETFINRLNTIIYGIRDGKQISFTDFATLNLPCPSIEEQEEIAKILIAATSELNQYQQQLQMLQQQKKGLMQQLLTGKVRVKI